MRRRAHTTRLRGYRRHFVGTCRDTRLQMRADTPRLTPLSLRDARRLLLDLFNRIFVFILVCQDKLKRRNDVVS